MVSRRRQRARKRTGGPRRNVRTVDPVPALTSRRGEPEPAMVTAHRRPHRAWPEREIEVTKSRRKPSSSLIR